MSENTKKIFIGNTSLKQTVNAVEGRFVTLFGESYYKIHNYDNLEPFFMSLVSSSNHWLFISSTGGLTAGRVSSEQSLFPYYTDDKLTENYQNTGKSAILLINRSNRLHLWEPFSNRSRENYRLERNLYKNISGTSLLFEEINLDLGLSYRYAWRTSDKYGFIKTTWLNNISDTTCRVECVDGLQNLLPANVHMPDQLTFGSLLDAYKRSELDHETGLALFTLNSILTDLPEPCESLLANSVFQVGLDPTGYLISSTQLEQFRTGMGVETETEVRGRRGAYFVHASLELSPQAVSSWHLLADVSQDSSVVVEKKRMLQGDRSALVQDLERDIAANQLNLQKIVGGADGLQITNDLPGSAHHFANVLFNVMRGGTFADQYWISKKEFIDFVSIRDHSITRTYSQFFTALPERILVSDLNSIADSSTSPDVARLSHCYLPLIFSRRHGDPSRPWNRFAINLKNPDGSLRLGFEGNWRDIFQNWEALAYSYPEFVENMICTFLSSTTADGYNPYRITYNGLDWEAPEPGNPWANIGYWSDHQIIYLLKLMELSAKVHPGMLLELQDRPIFSYSNVPYRLKPYAEILQDPYHTVIFDWELELQVKNLVQEIGTDGKLVDLANGGVLHASFIEKLLTLLLAKLVNFVPEGGIWMNTQRPEWNDANNALVGKGLSVVTLCYLRRFVVFWKQLLSTSSLNRVSIRVEVGQFYDQVFNILDQYKHIMPGEFDDLQRRAMVDALGEVGSAYRWSFYQHGFSGESTQLAISDLVRFLELVERYVEHSLRANRRADNLYHAYNIRHLSDGHASVSHLYEMLEGQVAILSSGLLSAEESLALLNSLRHGPLYQADRHSYILYPDHSVPSFFEKNRLSEDRVGGLELVKMLINSNETSLIVKDIDGYYHFNGHFRNGEDVKKVLDSLGTDPQYAALVAANSSEILDLFEATFQHDQFTGRAGTFFAYEGLGSVYWHMVSKLLLAIQETIQRFRDDRSVAALIDRYRDIRAGLGFNKSPAAFGAFPTDPYSHTPKGQGAKQPGMTGQVKEEILTRLYELGLSIQNGQLVFDPLLLDTRELLTEPSEFSWLDVNGQEQFIEVPSKSLAYTFCQVPIVILASPHNKIQVFMAAGGEADIEGLALDLENSQHIFKRSGLIHHLVVLFHSPG